MLCTSRSARIDRDAEEKRALTVVARRPETSPTSAVTSTDVPHGFNAAVLVSIAWMEVQRVGRPSARAVDHGELHERGGEAAALRHVAEQLLRG